MAQTKMEKIASFTEEIRQLKERQKQLLQQHNLQERKDRTKRLCKWAGLLESMLPNTISLTDEQFKAFLEKAILTDMHTRRLPKSHPILSFLSHPNPPKRHRAAA